MINKNNKLPLPIKETLIRKTLDLLKQNFTPVMIEKDLSPEYSPDQITEAVQEAVIILQTDHFTNSQNILILHTKRYQKDINRLLNFPSYPENKNPSAKQILATKERKIKAYLRCIDTMGQLEALLNLTTSDGLSLEINNEVQVKIQKPEEPSPYDLSRLSFEERVELNHIFDRAKVGTYENRAITPANNITDDQEVKLIANAGADLQLVKQHTPEPEVAHQEANSLDPTSRLRESLRKLQAKKIREIGGHLDEQEIILLNTNN